MLAEALASALNSAREARARSDAVFTLLPDTIDGIENPGHVIINLLDVFAEIFWLYALYHQMLKPCAQISDVDLHALVTAVVVQKANGHQTSAGSARAFGDILRELRASLGFSSGELAVRSGLESERFRQIESGLSEPNLGELSSTRQRSISTPPSSSAGGRG
jgi:hypothetical protein